MTAADLARVKIAPGPSPMMETMNVLRSPIDHDLRPELHSSRCAEMPMLTELSRRPGSFPNFLVPVCEQIDDGVERLLSTPCSVIQNHLDEHRLTGYSFPSWARRLGNGDIRPLQQLASSMRYVHDQRVRPAWAQMSADSVDDRQSRVAAMGRQGIDSLLSGLGPLIRWRPPVIEIVIRQRADFDVNLQDRGLLLVPTAFNGGWPCFSFPGPGPDPAVLYYPVVRRQREPADGRSALAALLGATRSLAMEALAAAPGLSTAELAARTSTSSATASQHATVLRNAGLIATTRRRKAVAHELTPLGRDLFRGGSNAP